MYFCNSNNILYSGFGASEEALSVLSPKVSDHSELSHQVYMCTGGTFQAMAELWRRIVQVDDDHNQAGFTTQVR